MEYIQLYSFYHGLNSWPKTESELVLAAEKVAKLLNAQFAALLIFPVSLSVTGSDHRIGVKFMGENLLERFGTTLLQDFLKKKIEKFKETEGGSCLRQIQLEKNDLVFPGYPSAPAIRHIAFVPFSSKGLLAGIRNQEQGTDSGWLVVGRDQSLSETDEVLLIAAAQRLLELCVIEQLKVAVEVRNQFLSIVSHELKTPLTSIYGILQLQDRVLRLKKEPTDVTSPGRPETLGTKNQKRSYLKILLRQVERMNELIDGLLDVSRIQNGRFVVEPAEADVAILLRETIQGRLQVISQDAGVKLSVEAPQNLVAWVDPVRMEEVITNLIMNAIRFSPEGGVVWIKLRQDPDGFRLTVRDQGPSVPPEDRDRLFRPFERTQRTSRLGGLGLGLYISRQITLLHCGNVSLIESVPGKGNVIEAYFPAVRPGSISS